MTLAATVRDHVREHRSGMFVDLVFAATWVAVVTALFGYLGAPTWATHLALFGGVVAYFGFFASLEATRRSE